MDVTENDVPHSLFIDRYAERGTLFFRVFDTEKI